MHTFKIIISNINAFTKMCVREQEKIEAKQKINNIHVAFKLSCEASVSVFITLWLRSTMPRSEITRLQIWE